MQVYFHANQSHFHKNGFVLRLLLKQRHKGTRKWPIHVQSVVVVSSKKLRHHVPIPQGSIKTPFPSWGTGRDDCKIRVAERTNHNHSFNRRLIY